MPQLSSLLLKALSVLGDTQLPVLAHFLFAALQVGCGKDPSRGSPSPQTPQIPGQLCKGTAGAIGKCSKGPILSSFAVVQGWGVFGVGEKQQRNSKWYFEMPNNPKYKAVYNLRL